MADENKGIASIALPAGSFVVEDLDKALTKAAATKDEGERSQAIEDAIVDQRAPIQTNYQEKPVAVNTSATAVPPDHELKEIDDPTYGKSERMVAIPDDEIVIIPAAEASTKPAGSSSSTAPGESGKDGRVA